MKTQESIILNFCTQWLLMCHRVFWLTKAAWEIIILKSFWRKNLIVSLGTWLKPVQMHISEPKVKLSE